MSKSPRKLPISLFVSSITLVALGLLLTDPFQITMNNMMLILISGLLFASFGIFAGLLWQEKASDEREGQIIDRGGRFAYLTGMSILITALVIQSFDHTVDNWLVVTIAVMIISKQVYVHIKR